MLTIDDITQKVRAYNSRADLNFIKKAYDYSAKAHEGQTRLSGHPFVVHPLEVANILAEMQMDVSSIAAGILHDTLEDTDATKEEITSIFGPDIAELVDGVTKLSKLQFNTREERQAENFRKMIVAMSKDIRVILIKLADRLNNMRTLQFMPEEKQMRIAQETLDIYAPLAHRMGIQWMKVQLEDLSFRFLKPEVFKQLEKKIGRLKKNREEFIERVKRAVTDCFKGSITRFEIVGRMKHIYGLFQKMERQNILFEQVHDLIAFRILTETLEECYEALGLLHSLWKPVPGRFKDYIAMPKTNNYQSLHTTVICLDGERVEFQIRTFTMHEVAEKGIASHWKYKEGGILDMESETTFRWLRQLVDWQKELKDSLEFMDTVKLDLFATDIYVFTPKGDVRALPYSATPLDFAFSIHTDVGTHCQGAKVNGRIVPLSYKLEAGDEVEILTHPGRHPTKDWLKIVVSPRAKAQIRQHLKQEQKTRSVSLGKNIFEEECAKIGADSGKILKMDEFPQYLKKKGITGEASFYSAVAYGKVSMPSFLSQVVPGLVALGGGPAKEGLLRRIFRKVSQRTKDLVLIDGLDEILVSFAKCCSPVQGDPIVGFVTRGRGVTIHRTDCSAVPSIDPERRVRADWNYGVDLTRMAKLKILCENRTGMLAEIAKVVSERKMDITQAAVRTTKDEKAIILMQVGVRNVSELHAMMKGVEKIDGVITVEREIK
ncbi:MAG: bifunctional (p)ppGpp synthetase/guanosine-3',5'-bis(diphosphate) 3'-pyrophosphohydrolase [Deltaproteobacteria bacterium]|nr:bifunctional (p)ppGpp synthetase/guanosine-3',5'-bis(diphosphate) 3'-pyrophosphohydrolase [Deltaproteobacteria bacterium]